MKSRTLISVAAVLMLGATAGCGGGGGSPEADAAAKAHGPINIWYSNNAQEVAWGKQMVAAWNAAHPTEKVDRAGDPGGQVLGGGHRRRDHGRQRTVPDLQHLPGGGAELPAAGRPGAARATSPTAPATSRRAPGPAANQYKSPDGKYYQLPWKSNPVMIFYNKKEFAKAGISTTDAPAGHATAQFLDYRQEAGVLGRGEVRHLPVAVAASSSSRGSTSTRCTRPRAAESSWSRTRRPRSTPTPGRAVAGFWQQMYAQNLAGKETYNGDSFADGTAAMAIVGPWAIAATRARSTGAWCRCRPSRAARTTRHRRSATPRTSACTPPARTAAPPGTS